MNDNTTTSSFLLSVDALVAPLVALPLALFVATGCSSSDAKLGGPAAASPIERADGAADAPSEDAGFQVPQEEAGPITPIGHRQCDETNTMGATCSDDSLSPLVDARSFEPDLEFVASDGLTILAVSVGSRDPTVVQGVLQNGELDWILADLEDDAAPHRRPVDVALDTHGGFVALLCGPDDCALYGPKSEADATLVALPGGVVPMPMSSIRQVSTGTPGPNPVPDDNNNHICVLGEGVRCYLDGDWDTAISLELRHNAVAHDHTALLGVGDKVEMVPADKWIWASSPVEAELFSVDLMYPRFLAGGTGGAFLYGEVPDMCTTGKLWACNTGGTDVIRAVIGMRASVLIERNGRTLVERHHSNTWCEMASEIPDVIDGGIFDCGVQSNVMVLTSTELYGAYACE